MHRTIRSAAVGITVGTLFAWLILLTFDAVTDTSQPVTTPVTVTIPAGTAAPAWADGCTTDADCAEMERSLNAAGLYLTGGGGVTAAEELVDMGWACALGTGDCTGWTPVPQELGDALAEGDDTPPESAATRAWESCVITYADTSLIVCPDGFTTTS